MGSTVLDILVPCQDGTIVRLRPCDFLERGHHLRQFLEQEQCCPSLWSKCSLYFYRLGKLEMFQSFLEKAVDQITTSFIASYASKRSHNEQHLFNLKSAQGQSSLAYRADDSHSDSSVLTTLAGYYVHQMFLASGCLSHQASRISQSQFESYVYRVEDLLRKAQLLRQSLDVHPKNQCDEENSQRHMFQTSQVTICSEDEYSSILNGYLLLASYTYAQNSQNREKLISKACSVFNAILESSPYSLLALLGLAAVHYACKRFKKALDLYAMVLWMYPHNHVGVRLGIGFCQLNLKNNARSLQCFQRVLQLCPKNTEALIGLYWLSLVQGIPQALQTNESSQAKLLTHSVLKEVTQLVIRAYKLNPFNFLNLIFLMNLCFLSERLNFFTSLLFHAKSVMRHPSHYAEIAYMEGRLHHKNKNFIAAQEHYQECLNAMPDNLSARYGLAQIYLWQHRIEDAQNELLILLRQCPIYIPTLRLYSYVCLKQVDDLLNQESAYQATKIYSNLMSQSAKSGTVRFNSTNSSEKMPCHDFPPIIAVYCNCAEEALEYIGRFDSDDHVVLMLQIHLNTVKYLLGQRSTFLSRVLPLYEAILQISWTHLTYETKAMDTSNPFRLILCHNLAVCYALNRECKKASVMLDHCMEMCRDPTCCKSVKELFEKFKTTFLFNRALMSEDSGDHSEATRLYQSLSSDSSNVYNLLAQQRLCWMALAMSDLAQAKKLFSNSTKYDVKNQSAFISVLLEIYEKEEQYEKSIKELQAYFLQEKQNAQKSYYETLLGRIYHIQGSRQAMKKKSFRHSHVETKLSLAALHYCKAVSLDARNWHACNGLAVLLAEQSRLRFAFNVFSLLLNECKASLSSNPNDSFWQSDTKASDKVNLSTPDLACFSLISQDQYRRRAMCHQNLGLLYASLAVTETRRMIPADQVKIAKALKHMISSLDFGAPNPFSVYLQMSRLLHDASRFRECQRILEVALNRWNDSVLLYYNLAYVLGKCVSTELQIEKNFSDSNQINRWIQDCEQSEALFDKALVALNSYSGLQHEALENLRDYIQKLRFYIGKISSSKDFSNKFLKDDKLKQICRLWECQNGLAFASKGFLSLPSVSYIKNQKMQMNEMVEKHLRGKLSTSQKRDLQSKSNLVLDIQTQAFKETQIEENNTQHHILPKKQVEQYKMLQQKENGTSIFMNQPSDNTASTNREQDEWKFQHNEPSKESDDQDLLQLYPSEYDYEVSKRIFETQLGTDSSTFTESSRNFVKRVKRDSDYFPQEK